MNQKLNSDHLTTSKQTENCLVNSELRLECLWVGLPFVVLQWRGMIKTAISLVDGPVFCLQYCDSLPPGAGYAGYILTFLKGGIMVSRSEESV